VTTAAIVLYEPENMLDQAAEQEDGRHDDGGDAGEEQAVPTALAPDSSRCG